MEKRANRETVASLRRKVADLSAQLIHLYQVADSQVEKAGQRHLMASGAIVQITALGGREIVPPVLIRDGLSDETIAAIRADLRRSYATAVAFKPKGA